MTKTQTEPYLSSYLHSKGRALGLPIGGNFEITSRCNFNCPMCYIHSKQENIATAEKELTAKQWISLAREARDKGMMFALITGGEPFVRKDFFEIYNGFSELGLMISINSNGSMIYGDNLKKLLENPPFRMNISLYGGSNETYQRMCGLPAFDRVLENISVLKEKGVDVRLNLSITPYNRADLKDVFDIAQKLKLHIKTASYMYPPVRINGSQYGSADRLTPDEAAACTVEWDLYRFSPQEFMMRAGNIAKLDVSDDSDCATDITDGISCRAGSSSFWITWDGRMLPCGMMPYPVEYPLRDGFELAWNNIISATKKLKSPTKCISCPHKDVCSACAAVCVTETGDFDKVPEYACLQTKALIQKTQETYRVIKEKYNGN